MGYSTTSPLLSVTANYIEGYRRKFQHLNFMRRTTEAKKCITLFTLAILFWMITFQYGIFTTNIFGKSKLNRNWSYPMDLLNFPETVNQFRLGTLDLSITKPINLKYSEIPFIKLAINSEDLNTPVGLLIIVKSATRNYEKRATIRRTWGDPSYLNATMLSSTRTKLVFICGIPLDHHKEEELFPDENINDIILADFDDTYSNNTYKSILALRWAVMEFVSNYEYLLLVDDDVYVDLFNLEMFLRTLPSRQAIKYFEKQSGPAFPYLRLSSRYNSPETVPAISRGQLLLGRVFGNAKPFRRPLVWNFGSSKLDKKWFVSVEDYSPDLYPPYVPGAGMVLSKTTVTDFYYASFFVKHYWIDDVYLGILAYKLGILPLHCPHFKADYFGVKSVEQDSDAISETIVIHGFDCCAQMEYLWKTRNSTGLKFLTCDKS